MEFCVNNDEHEFYRLLGVEDITTKIFVYIKLSIRRGYIPPDGPLAKMAGKLSVVLRADDNDETWLPWGMSDIGEMEGQDISRHDRVRQKYSLEGLDRQRRIQTVATELLVFLWQAVLAQRLDARSALGDYSLSLRDALKPDRIYDSDWLPPEVERLYKDGLVDPGPLYSD
jgi:hypothetical protein